MLVGKIDARLQPGEEIEFLAQGGEQTAVEINAAVITEVERIVHRLAVLQLRDPGPLIVNMRQFQVHLQSPGRIEDLVLAVVFHVYIAFEIGEIALDLRGGAYGRTVVNVFESASDAGRNLIVAAVLEVEEELRVILFVRTLRFIITV